MQIDDRKLRTFIEESEDLQADAMRGSSAILPDLRDIAADRRRSGESPPTDTVRFDLSRRSLLRNLGLTSGAIAGSAVLGTGFGAALAGIVATPAAADQSLDVQILQTASSLELLAVATYTAALSLPFIANGNKTIVAFAQTTMKQHDDHRAAFQAQTKALGGPVQDQPNPKFAAVVEKAKPNLKTPADVVTLAATLETVATDTYLTDLAMFSDTKSKELMGSVMGVESQHLAVLRAVGALLAANMPDLIAVPTVLAKLPAAAGSVAFPKPFETPTTDLIATPETGAVK